MILRDTFIILVLVSLNGFFVAVEFAAVASRRTRLDLITGGEGKSAAIVRGWLDNSAARDRLIAATQLGITAVSLALGAVGENTFEALLEPYFHEMALPPELRFINAIIPAIPLIVSLILVTSVHVVLGEQVPKVAVLRAPERFALAAAPIMNVFTKVFKGFVSLLDWATRSILTLFGLPSVNPHSSPYSLEEIRQIVAGPEVEGVIQQPEREMLSAIFDFGELIVRQVAIPRTEIIAVEADMPLEEVATLATQTTVSKFPVYEDSFDQIIGILHVRELLTALLDPKRRKGTARSLVREALFIPETISVNDLLHHFRLRRQHIAIVLDEFGGTAGLVTLEDLLEEIVGEVSGPFDPAQPSIQPLEDGTVLVDGMTPIEDINQSLKMHLYDPNYDTIAGYMLGKLGRIPQVGDHVDDPENQLRLKVETMDRLRIAQLSLERIQPDGETREP